MTTFAEETAGSPSAADMIPEMPNFKAGNLVRSLLVGIGFATGTAIFLSHHGVALPVALAISAVFPVADTTYEWIKSRRLNAVDTISMIAIVVGVSLSLWRSDPRFALAKESVTSGVIGLYFLSSLFRGRPAIFLFARETTDKPENFGWLWDNEPRFRSTMRGMTILWGSGLLVESALRMTAAVTLPPPTTLILSPVIAVVSLGALIAWTAVWARHARSQAVAAVSTAAASVAAGVPETAR